MLDGLRHHTLIGGHHQQRDIYAANARQHVLDEALVPRHINNAGLASAGQRQPGKAQFNRHAARLLLGQTIRVNAGERGHESGFAVVHMACRADATHSCAASIERVTDSLAEG